MKKEHVRRQKRNNNESRNNKGTINKKQIEHGKETIKTNKRKQHVQTEH